MSNKDPVDTFEQELQIRKNAHGNDYAESTIDGYLRGIGHWRDWLQDRGDTLTTEVTDRDVRMFLSDKGDVYAENTVQNMRKAVALFYRYVADTPPNPTEDLDRAWGAETEKSKRLSDPVEYLKESEVRRLIENVPTPTVRNKLLLKIMVMTGVRRSEVASLETDRVDLEDRTLEVWDEKNDEYREVGYRDPKGSDLTTPLRIWRESKRGALHDVTDGNPFLFPSEQGNTDHVSPNRIRVIVHKAAKAADLQDDYGTDANGNTRHMISPHTLRHTFTVRCAQVGVSVPYVRDQLGHHDISVTNIYTKMAKSDAADKMAEEGPPL